MATFECPKLLYSYLCDVIVNNFIGGQHGMLSNYKHFIGWGFPLHPTCIPRVIGHDKILWSECFGKQ